MSIRGEVMHDLQHGGPFIAAARPSGVYLDAGWQVATDLGRSQGIYSVRYRPYLDSCSRESLLAPHEVGA